MVFNGICRWFGNRLIDCLNISNHFNIIDTNSRRWDLWWYYRSTSFQGQFFICFLLQFTFIISNILHTHIDPFIDPGKCLPMAQQQHITNATMNEIFNARLEAPNFKWCMHHFIRTHNWLIISPTFNQWTAFGFRRLEKLRIFFAFIMFN